MLEESLHERSISALVSFFDDVIEVPHRLVGMDYQSERNFIQGCYSFLCEPSFPVGVAPTPLCGVGTGRAEGRFHRPQQARALVPTVVP